MERDKILNKIRALLSKTMENGCTEEEMLTALGKAMAMKDAYEVSDEELKLTREEKAKLHPDDDKTDPHGIKHALCMGVAKFTETAVFRKVRNREYQLVFVGLPSDTAFAHWLLASLQTFVQGELTNHLAASLAPRGERRRIINGFVLGCTSRITARLIDMCKPPANQATNSRALVVTKQAAIKEAMKEVGPLQRGRASRRTVDYGSLEAGRKAGDRASFGRPVAGGHKQLT